MSNDDTPASDTVVDMRALSHASYLFSELDGARRKYQLTIGFETLEAMQAAHQAVADLLIAARK